MGNIIPFPSQGKRNEPAPDLNDLSQLSDAELLPFSTSLPASFNPDHPDSTSFGLRGVVNRCMQRIDYRMIGFNTLLVRPFVSFVARREGENTYSVPVGRVMDTYSPIGHLAILRAGYVATRLSLGKSDAELVPGYADWEPRSIQLARREWVTVGGPNPTFPVPEGFKSVAPQVLMLGRKYSLLKFFAPTSY